tara:strand:+ start:111 stop:1019 length:909 start_codon:yes stop_codon:yes gene_type:complete
MYNLKNLTIIIVTFLTRKKTLLNCLNSIDKNVKIVIIENSANFKNKNLYLKKFKNLKIFCTGKNLGYGGGNNYGLKKVKTNYALILNPDTVLHKSFFKNLYLIIKKKNFDLIGCELLKNKSFMTGGFFSKKKNLSFKKEYFTKKRKNFTKVDWITGSTMLLNLEKIKYKKVFDENFFLYFEEFDFCQKLKKDKKKVFLCKNLIVDHLGFKSSYSKVDNFELESEKLRNWHWMWSYFYYYKKNYGFLIAVSKVIGKLLRSLFKTFFYILFFDKKNMNKYLYRFLGLSSSIANIRSFYRGKFFN